MRVLRFLPFVFASILLVRYLPLSAQQTPSATKDPQAVSILTQALAVAGGVTAITAISDYTAAGNATYYTGVNQSINAGVTVRGKGLGQFRIDSNLPLGTRSESTDGLTTIKYEDGFVKQLHAQAPLNPARLLLPFLQLSPALTSPGFSLSYQGTVDVDGNPAYDIQVQRVLPGGGDPNSPLSRYLTVDYFIDPSTFQIVMMQDLVPYFAPRQMRYSDFRLVSGVLVPFSISETVQGQKFRLIQLDQISFNSGLQDSDFSL